MWDALMILNLFANILAAVFLITPNDSIFYRSPALQEVNLTPVPGQFSILNDNGEQIDITAMSDEQGVLYWYRRIKTPVCLTGECMLVDVGLYWDCTGDFFGLDVYGEHLTKTDHSIFSDADYQNLLDILSNDWSILREYDFTELTNENTETEGEGERVDATSGATRKEIASEAVQDAVYTTYTLWHLVHNGEKEQLMGLTADAINRHPLIDRILESGSRKYIYFLLELFTQSKIDHADKLTPLIIEGLKSGGDLHLQNLCLKSLTRLDINALETQKRIADIYSPAPEDFRLRILTALKDITRVSRSLYSVLEGDVHRENEWFAEKVLNLLSKASTHSPRVIEGARKLSESKNSYIKESADRFLESLP